VLDADRAPCGTPYRHITAAKLLPRWTADYFCCGGFESLFASGIVLPFAGSVSLVAVEPVVVFVEAAPEAVCAKTVGMLALSERATADTIRNVFT